MTEQTAKKKRLVILGAGPAGYPAAFRASKLGFDVILIDPRPTPGGVCLYQGCIPSKALLHATQIIREAKSATHIGLSFDSPTIDLDQLRNWKQQVISDLTDGLQGLCKSHRVEYKQGRARFLDSHRVAIESSDGANEEITFDYALIATGSRPIEIPSLSTETVKPWYAREALALPSVPGRLLVVGGGYIGLELGSVYAELGSRVTVAEMMPSLLPGVERDLVTPLARALESRFDAIHLKTRASSVSPLDSGGVKVQFESEQDAPFEAEFDQILIAVGRRPVTEELGLDNTKVQLTDNGFIQVNECGWTTDDAIFAAGDVAGQPMLAHKATHQALAAIETLAGNPAPFTPRAIPAVVFTDPEIAWCGLTSSEAKQQKIKTRNARCPWGASGRARAMNHSEGMSRLLVDRASGTLLGAGIVGHGAGELIGEAALAVEQGLTAEQVANTIHPHPTLSETLMDAAMNYLASR